MIKHLSTVTAAVLLAMNLSNAKAATVSLSPSLSSVPPGDSFTLDVMIDFTGDATLGGGMDIFYDSSALSFQSFTFGTANVTLDPSFSRSPDVLTNKLEGLAFGNFGGLTSSRVGTLTFQALAPGKTALSMAATSDPRKGGAFYSGISFEPQTVTFDGAAVQVSLPVPAAAWLFGSALVGLAGLARRRVV